jgi:hypothetical protein
MLAYLSLQSAGIALKQFWIWNKDSTSLGSNKEIRDICNDASNEKSANCSHWIWKHVGGDGTGLFEYQFWRSTTRNSRIQ